MAKMKSGPLVKALIMGGGILLVYPIIGGFIGGLGLDFLGTAILGATVGDILSAGLAAFGIEWAMESFMK